MTPHGSVCPFFGMNPYLEAPALWPEFHTKLVATLFQILLPGVIDRYKVLVTEDNLEIRERSDGRLVTLIQVVSPTNKVTPAGRQAYLDKRREGRNAGANVVEIDLVLLWQPTLEYSRDGLPEWDYAATVTRSTQPGRSEIYTTTLQKRLPRFRVPMAADDRDTVLDLNAAFHHCYAQGNYDDRIDYGYDPPVPLNEEKRCWLDKILVAERLREPTPPHEVIARAAYLLWEEEGRAHGRDREHWIEAQAMLRRRKRQDR